MQFLKVKIMEQQDIIIKKEDITKIGVRFIGRLALSFLYGLFVGFVIALLIFA